jgi:hypothetical protein
MANPVWCADNRLTQDTTILSPAEDPSFPETNLTDGRLFEVYKPTSSGTTVDIITDAGVGMTGKVDYFGLSFHDLSDPAKDALGAVTATFAHSPDNAVYTTIFTVAPTDNTILFRTFPQEDKRYYRLRLTRGSGFIPTLGELAWGQRVESPHGISVDFDPLQEPMNARVSRSMTGQILGAVKEFSERRADINIPLLPNSFVGGTTLPNFRHFWDTHASLLNPFFFSWNPGNPGSFEKDAFFAVIDPSVDIARPLSTQLDVGRRGLIFSIEGVKE